MTSESLDPTMKRELQKLRERDAQYDAELVAAKAWLDIIEIRIRKLVRLQDGCKKAIAEMTLVKTAKQS